MRIQKPFVHITFAALLAINTFWAHAEILFIGQGELPGDAKDQSKLPGLLEDGVTPHDQAGGFGSAIAYSGRGNVYVALPDRGPADGATSYIDRLYTLRLSLQAIGPNLYEIKPEITKTKLLRIKPNTYFSGSAQAFDATNSPNSLRLDPEGVRVGRCRNTVFVSDEYGPFLYEFDRDTGKRVRVLNVPNKYLIDYPSVDSTEELTKNIAGRQSNRGMEGLAISPDGAKLYGIMQSPLLQDGALDADNKRIGVNARIVKIDVRSGVVREFLYPLDSKSNGVSEILAINDHEFLVLERDGKPGSEAIFKKIFRIDISAASDIRALKQLPTSGLPEGIVPVTKELFIDMLDPAYGLAGDDFPEKLEALAFGPDLNNGRLLLIVASDNDFDSLEPTRFFAFAIDRDDLPGFQAQEFGPKGGVSCHPG